MQPEHKVARGQVVAHMAKRFPYDAFERVAGNRFGGKPLGDNHSKTGACRFGRSFTRRCNNEHRPSSDTLAFQGGNVFGGAVQARR